MSGGAGGGADASASAGVSLVQGELNGSGGRLSISGGPVNFSMLFQDGPEASTFGGGAGQLRAGIPIGFHAYYEFTNQESSE